MKPFLKWAGGKRWLIDRFKPCFPDQYGKYIEPFLGGGSVFFSLEPHDGIIADTNDKLINAYQVVKNHPEELWSLLQQHHKQHCKDHYYEQRKKSYSSSLEKAAQFIYLNRTCWNGLYRENLSGKFNVPKGTKDTVIFPDDDFKSWSKALQKINLNSDDFAVNVEKANTGDLIFADPPYVDKIINNDKFIKYGKKMFTWKDQERLFESLSSAASRGVKVIVTNKLTEDIEKLYGNFPFIWKVSRSSQISGDANYRVKYGELVCSNFDLFPSPELEKVI